MRKITRNPRLLKERDGLILRLYLRGFFIDEVGEIFRLQKSRVSQIIKKVEADKKNKKVKNNDKKNCSHQSNNHRCYGLRRQ